MRGRFIWLSFGLVLLVAACVTVNVYFPASAVQKAADEIVEDVRTKGQKPPVKPDSTSWLKEGLMQFLPGPTEACAQMNIDVSTPAIRALRENMKVRFPTLKPFYDNGNIGETNSGLLEVRDMAGLSLKDSAQLNRLTDQENKDRMTLYREIVSANKLGQEAIPQLQKLFANSWRQQSQPGWWLQNDKGEWERKK
jgi:uncharacterized protein